MKRVDLETVEAIDRLGDRMDALQTSLDGRIDTVHRSLGVRIDALDQRIDAVEGTLGNRIDAVASLLGNRIDAVESRLGNRIDAVETTLGNRIDTVETTLGNRIDGLGGDVADLRVELATLRTELHQGLEEGRRYALVLNESTRHDIRMVAEGVAALAVKIDSRHR